MAGFVEGVDRGQSTLFPALLDDYVAEDNPVRAVDVFVDKLDRRLGRECQRNIEVIWLTGQLAPDFKTIADFRKDNGKAIRESAANSSRCAASLICLLERASPSMDRSSK